MQRKRFEELEGLRGVAAVVVAIYHFLLAFYLFAFFGAQSGAVQHMRLEDNWYGSPLAVLFSGSFAVAVFFVLSGFVLSVGFFESKNIDNIKRLAAKRYLRLMIPALASTLVCFVIITIGNSKINEVGSITHSQWLLENWQISPTLFEAFKSGMFDIFTSGSSPFNNVLWTMTIEFIGSFIVFGYLVLFGLNKHRWLGYVFLLIATFNTWFFAFIIGMIVADLYAVGILKTKKLKPITIISGIGLAAFLGSYPVRYAESSSLYGFFTSLSSQVHWDVVLVTLGAAILFLLVLLSNQVSRVFSTKWLSKLGKYTFSLYLVHIPVIYTVGLSVFLVAYNTLGLSYNISVFLTFIATAPVVAGVTILFDKYVDRPSVILSSKFANFFLGDKDILVTIKVWYKRYLRKIIRMKRIFVSNSKLDTEDTE